MKKTKQKRPDGMPADLGPHGAALWLRVTSEYDISDCGGAAMLEQAARATDRAENCRAAIDRDGEMIEHERGAREHPLLKAEMAARAFVVRTIQRLGLSIRARAQRPRPSRCSRVWRMTTKRTPLIVARIVRITPEENRGVSHHGSVA